MSSILNALKKLENETGQQTSLIDSADTRKTVRRSTMRTWLFYSMISALITIGILIGGGWMLLRQKPTIAKWLHGVSSEEKKEILKPKPDKASQPPVPPVVRSEPVIAKAPEIPKLPDKKSEFLNELPEKKHELPKPPEKTIIVPKVEQVTVPPRPAPSRSIPDSPPVAETPRLTPAEISNLTEAEVEAEIQKELEKAGITETIPEAVVPPPPAAAPASSPQTTQIEGIGIQALVWSEDPKSRMVMMNNHIFHIGDIFDRFHIKDIGSDFVLLTEGTREHKIDFHRK